MPKKSKTLEVCCTICDQPSKTLVEGHCPDCRPPPPVDEVQANRDDANERRALELIDRMRGQAECEWCTRKPIHEWVRRGDLSPNPTSSYAARGFDKSFLKQILGKALALCELCFDTRYFNPKALRPIVQTAYYRLSQAQGPSKQFHVQRYRHLQAEYLKRLNLWRRWDDGKLPRAELEEPGPIKLRW